MTATTLRRADSRYNYERTHPEMFTGITHNLMSCIRCQRHRPTGTLKSNPRYGGLKTCKDGCEKA